MIKITSPKLTKEQYAKFTRARDFLADVRDAIALKVEAAAAPRKRLDDAFKRREEIDGIGGTAAFDSTIAGELTGLREQIRLLAPVVEQKDKALGNEIADAGQQIG